MPLSCCYSASVTMDSNLYDIAGTAGGEEDGDRAHLMEK